MSEMSYSERAALEYAEATRDEAFLLEELLTVEEVAPLLKVRPEWLYAAVRRNEVPHVKVGRYVRFNKADLSRWIEQGGHR